MFGGQFKFFGATLVFFLIGSISIFADQSNSPNLGRFIFEKVFKNKRPSPQQSGQRPRQGSRTGPRVNSRPHAGPGRTPNTNRSHIGESRPKIRIPILNFRRNSTGGSHSSPGSTGNTGRSSGTSSGRQSRGRRSFSSTQSIFLEEAQKFTQEKTNWCWAGSGRTYENGRACWDCSHSVWELIWRTVARKEGISKSEAIKRMPYMPSHTVHRTFDRLGRRISCSKSKPGDFVTFRNSWHVGLITNPSTLTQISSHGSYSSGSRPGVITRSFGSGSYLEDRSPTCFCNHFLRSCR